MKQHFYELLPAYLRNRDWYEGEPLRALLEVLEWQHRRLEGDVDQLYADWFIESCQDRLVPLLGDLLGVRGLDDPDSWVPGQRARVANSLIYRRSKGTAATLSRVARDVTGWPAIVRPGFRSLVFAQRLDHLRPERGRVVDLRAGQQIEALGGPFDPLAHVVRPTRAAGSCGGPGPGEMAIHFWRLRSYPVRGWTARWLDGGRFSMHPLGIDMPLFSRRRSPRQADRQLEAHHLPRRLDRRSLGRALDALRAGDSRAAELLRDPPFEVVDPASGAPVPWAQMVAADLSDATRPATASGEDREPAARVAVDPELGRFAFVGGPVPEGPVRINRAYGFSADIGGGPYERPSAAAEIPGLRRAEVGAEPSDPQAQWFPDLMQAVDERPEDPSPPIQVLEIADSATYGGAAGLHLPIQVEEGSWLLIEAATGQFPCYLGDLLFIAQGDSPNTRITLSGLMIGGCVRLRGTARLEIRHCTIASPPDLDFPGAAVSSVEGADSGSSVLVASSIVGPLRLAEEIGGLVVEDSIVDGMGGKAIAADDRGAGGPRTTVRRSTILGPVSVVELAEATDSLLVDGLATRSGSLRHCYCPPDPAGPPRDSCVPDDALEAAASAGQRAERLARLRPVFAARRYGEPAYAQLAACTPAEIRTGASSGSEMGVFESLRNTQRERNLDAVLREYLPWGQEARIRYES